VCQVPRWVPLPTRTSPSTGSMLLLDKDAMLRPHHIFNLSEVSTSNPCPTIRVFTWNLSVLFGIDLFRHDSVNCRHAERSIGAALAV
jgi:hypothetical protein